MKRILSIIAKLIALTSLLHFLASCSSQAPHSGLFPFSTMEKLPSQGSAARRSLDCDAPPQRMTKVLRYHADLSINEQSLQHAIDQIQIDDVIAFYMNHQQARGHLKRGLIQKIPYELCRYGILDVVTPRQVTDSWGCLIE